MPASEGWTNDYSDIDFWNVDLVFQKVMQYVRINLVPFSRDDSIHSQKKVQDKWKEQALPSYVSSEKWSHVDMERSFIVNFGFCPQTLLTVLVLFQSAIEFHAIGKQFHAAFYMNTAWFIPVMSFQPLLFPLLFTVMSHWLQLLSVNSWAQHAGS